MCVCVCVRQIITKEISKRNCNEQYLLTIRCTWTYRLVNFLLWTYEIAIIRKRTTSTRSVCYLIFLFTRFDCTNNTHTYLRIYTYTCRIKVFYTTFGKNRLVFPQCEFPTCIRLLNSQDERLKSVYVYKCILFLVFIVTIAVHRSRRFISNDLSHNLSSSYVRHDSRIRIRLLWFSTKQTAFTA